MRGLAMIGAAALLAGCASTPAPEGGGFGGPSFAALQQMCGGQPADFGADTQAVYAATFDAYVANRRGKLSQEQYCGFQAALAQHYSALGTSHDPEARNQWVTYLNQQRAAAISWRAAVDPTLRAG
ncbi:hypothetical protein [Paraburkholderia acidipaludis]|uniref:hypothetical protein n=1 Tax=Paraburkholderia acidipaludis TaxID=660537 RepID=UPI00048390BA|nr:hypothetical protein [Paraburkholderia acidipaludis]